MRPSLDRGVRIGVRLRGRARGIDAAPGDRTGYKLFLFARHLSIGILSVTGARAHSLHARCQIRHQKKSVELYAGRGGGDFERPALLRASKDRIDDR